MTMLNPTEVLKSDIVANSTMNRSRGLSGVNSYTKDLRFDVMEWLVERRNTKGSAVWYDVCCGESRALFQGDKGTIWVIYKLNPPMYEAMFKSDVAEAFDMTVYADEIELYKRAPRAD